MIGALKASDEVQSRPVDLDQVAARLLDIFNDKDTSTEPASRPLQYDRFTTRSPPLPETYETEYYNDLVNDGGRPLYPISLMTNVSKNPKEHCEML